MCAHTQSVSCLLSREHIAVLAQGPLLWPQLPSLGHYLPASKYGHTGGKMEFCPWQWYLQGVLLALRPARALFRTMPGRAGTWWLSPSLPCGSAAKLCSQYPTVSFFPQEKTGWDKADDTFFQIKALPQIVFNWFAYLGGFFWDPSTSNLWGFLFVCFAGVRGKMKIWLCLRAAAPDILTMCSWRWPAHSEVYEQPSLVSPADKLQRHPCASTVQFITAHSGSLRTCCNFSYYHPSAFYESLGKHFLLSQNSFALAEH